MSLAHPHHRTKHQETRFQPYYQLGYSRESWRYTTPPRLRRFATEAEARAHLSALERRRSKGGRVIAKLEYRDKFGIWHPIQLTEGGAL